MENGPFIDVYLLKMVILDSYIFDCQMVFHRFHQVNLMVYDVFVRDITIWL